MELLGRELGTHWADFGIVEPNPNKTMPLVRSLPGVWDLLLRTMSEGEILPRLKHPEFGNM